jgi:hypothetical protein
MNLVNALGMARHMSQFSRIHALLGIRTSMHFIFEPLDFIAKLASLCTETEGQSRFHGVFDLNTQAGAIVNCLRVTAYAPVWAMSERVGIMQW